MNMNCDAAKTYPSYTARYDRKSVWRGDTLKSISFRLSDEEDNPIIPLSICAEIRRSRNDELIYQLAYTIDSDGWVVLQPVSGGITSGWPVGMHDYDVQYTLPGGVIRTYVSGTLAVFEDVSRC